MRTKITIKAASGVLPFNYHPHLASCIFDKIGKMCVSGIRFISKYATGDTGFWLNDTVAEIIVCTPHDHLFGWFENLQVGNVNFEIINIEEDVIDLKTGNVLISTLSPICVVGRNNEYLNPNENLYWDNMLDSAYKTYNAFHSERFDYTYEYQVQNQKARLITTFQGLNVKGYQFNAFLKTDIRLLQVLLHKGAGSQHSQGFGCVTMKEK